MNDSSLKNRALPRVLWVADEIPQSAFAGGILLKRLFSGYPSDRLVIIGNQPHPGAELLPVRYEHLRLSWERFTRTRFGRFVRSLHALGLMPSFTTSVEKLVGDFRPQVVMTVMQMFPHYQVAAQFANRHGLPLITVVHDLPGEFDNVYPFAAKALDRGIGNIYRQCQRRLCISPEMAALLEQKYGVTGEVLYPNRSEVIIPRPLEQSRSWKNPEVFTLGYAGSLSYGYGETVKKLCAVLSDGNIRLNYYGREDKALLGSFSRDTVVQQGFSSPPEMLWRKVQAECDAVILPYSFNEGYRPLYSSHFPSKLPEYLALNMPVIVLGPTYATGVRWALQNPDAAIAITQPQPDRWLEILRKLAASEQNRVSLAIGATDAGKRHFCPEKIKKIFTAAIIEAAENRMLTPVC